MISTISSGVKFQIRAGLSGYVAELGSCFLCHASYLASWLEVLSSEKRFIFSAAAHAQRAVAYLHDQQPKAAEVEEAA